MEGGNNTIPTASLNWLYAACTDDALEHPLLAHFRRGDSVTWSQFSELLTHFAEHNSAEEMRELGAEAWQHSPLCHQLLLVSHLAHHGAPPADFFSTIFGRLGLLASHYPLVFNTREGNNGVINIDISHPPTLTPCEASINVLLGMIEHGAKLTLEAPTIQEEATPNALKVRIIGNNDNDNNKKFSRKLTTATGQARDKLPPEYGALLRSHTRLSNRLASVQLPEERACAVGRNDQHLYRFLLNEVSDAVLVFARDGSVRHYNEAAAALFGDAMMRSNHLLDRLPGRPCQRDTADAVSNTASRWRTSIIDESGRMIPVIISHYHADTTDILVVRDDGYRKEIRVKRTAEQVAESQRTSLLGELAKGIVHEFKNLLLSLSSLIALQTVGNQHTRIAFLDELTSVVDYGSELADELLSFVRKDTDGPTIINLGELLNNQSKLLRQLLPYTIDMTTDIHDNLFIKAARVQVRQVLTNLAINARDAMPDQEGRLTIRAFPEQRDVVVEVSDTGGGIDPAIRQRIFEPSFTTKGPESASGGAGVGLAVTADIVRRHGGSIEIRSEVGSGTSFRLRFPSAVERDSFASPPEYIRDTD